MISPYFGLIALALVALLLPGLIVVAIRQKKLSIKLTQQEGLQNKLLVLERTMAGAASAQKQLEVELNELRTGSLTMAHRINQLEQAIAELAQSQPNPEELEPERRLYSRAVRMVELGADLDEVIQECELPRAEAELLVNLHRQK